MTRSILATETSRLQVAHHQVLGETSVLCEVEDIMGIANLTGEDERSEEDAFIAKARQSVSRMMMSSSSRSSSNSGSSTRQSQGSDEQDDDDDDDESTAVSDSDTSTDDDDDDDDESFKTARSSNSLFSNAATSIYETPEQWSNDDDMNNNNNNNNNGFSSLPNEVRIGASFSTMGKKKKKKKKSSKPRRMRAAGAQSLLSGKISTEDGMMTIKEQQLWSPSPTTRKQRYARLSKSRSEGGELNNNVTICIDPEVASSADSCWGDLGSMNISRRLGLTNSNLDGGGGGGGLDDSFRRYQDHHHDNDHAAAADATVSDWSDLSSSMRDSFSALDVSWEMPNSQSVDESWDELLRSPAPSELQQQQQNEDNSASVDQGDNNNGWLTDLIGSSAVEEVGGSTAAVGVGRGGITSGATTCKSIATGTTTATIGGEKGSSSLSFLEQFNESFNKQHNNNGDTSTTTATQKSPKFQLEIHSSFSLYSDLLSDDHDDDDANNNNNVGEDDSVDSTEALGDERNKTKDNNNKDDDKDDDSINDCYVRSIRFADEQGLPIHKVHYLGGDDDPMATGRLVILLLSPTNKKFEFTHLEYCIRDCLTVSDLLMQMPNFATSEVFSQTTYHSLYRTVGEDTKLPICGSTLLRNCDAAKNEILVPVMEHQTGNDIVQSAVPLLRNKGVMRMLRHAKRSGRGIRHVQSRQDFESTKALEQSQEGNGGARLYADV